MDKIRQYLVSRDKKDWMLFSILVFVVITGVFYCVHATSQQNVFVETPDETLVATSTSHVNTKKYFTEQIGRKLEEQEEEYAKAKEDIERQSKQAQDELDSLKQDNAMLHDELLRLRVEFEQSQQNGAPVDNAVFNDLNNNHQALSQDNTLINHFAQHELEVVSVELDKSESDMSKIPHASNYVSSGTHVKAVLLGGIDAHTEVYGNNETRVVTMRLIEEGIMPNGFKAPLKNCVLLASAWGNASSERVVMRGERLSCIHDDGKVFEQDISGIVYGPDGREDVKGKIVYPEGKLVERAFIAGTLSGLGAGVSDGFVTKSISPLGSTSTVNPGDVFGYGAAQGAYKSLDKLADYYIKRAEKLQPVIRVPAGVLVDVVIQKGFSLSFIKKTTLHKQEPKSQSVATNQAYEEAVSVLGNFSESYNDK